MNNVYELQSVSTSPRGAVKAELTENGVIIAKVTRAAVSNHYVAPFVTKFLGERAHARFEDFCDSLSASEVVEILYSNARAEAKV